MKFFIGFILAVLVLPFTTGASLIDKETKKMVEELNYKIEKLLQYGHTNHSEEMKAAQEQQEILQRLTTRVEALEKREDRRERAAAKDIEKIASATVDIPETPAPEAKLEPVMIQPAVVQAPATSLQPAPISATPAPSTPGVTNPSPAVSVTTPPIVQAATSAPQEPAKATTTIVAPVSTIPTPETKPAAATPVTTPNPVIATPIETSKPPLSTATAEARKPPSSAPSPPKPPEPVKKPVAKTVSPGKQGGSFDGVLPYLISGLSVLLMVFLFIRMKRSEQRIKTMLWRADMEALREDLARERKMNPKIHLTGEPGKIHLP